MTGQGHTTNFNMAEAPATTGGMPPSPYPTTSAAHNTHPPTETTRDDITRTLHTGVATAHPQCHTIHDRATVLTILQTKASLVQDTFYDTACRSYTQKASKSHLWKASPHRPQHQKKVIMQGSQSNSSSESDDDSYPLNY